MSQLKLMNQTKNKVLATHVIEANSIIERMKGLLGRQNFDENTAMWIRRCNNIHTFFMKFEIDAVFVDKSLKVKSVHRNLKPYQFVLPVWGANSVFEFSSTGACNDIEVGDQLNVGN